MIPIDRAGGDAASGRSTPPPGSSSAASCSASTPRAPAAATAGCTRATPARPAWRCAPARRSSRSACVGTREIQPPGATAPRPFRPCESASAGPSTSSRYRDRADDRLLLRQITDEVMYEIRELSGQDYVDEYATRTPEALPVAARGDARHRQRRGGGRRRCRRRPRRRARRPRPSARCGPGSPAARVRGQAPALGNLAAMADITITLPDGSDASGRRRAPTALGLAAAIGPAWPRPRSIAEVNGDERDLGGRWPTATGSRSSPRDTSGACTRSATRRPTCWPRRCSTCSPGPRSPSARRSRTASTTTSSCPGGGHVHARRPRPHRRPHARDHRRGPAVRPRRDPRRRRPRGLRRPPLQARDHRRRGRRPHVGHRRRARCAPTRTRRQAQGPPAVPRLPGFIDLCRGPHVPTPAAPRATSS